MVKWMVDYAVRRADGTYFEDHVLVDAENVSGAISLTDKMLKDKMQEADWKTCVIWNVGLMPDLEEVC